jgi:hypothetical protein
VLFVRMQVFLVFFLAVFTGLGLGALAAAARARWPVVVAAPVVLLLLISDLGHGILFGTVDERYREYVPVEQYAAYENAELIKMAWVYGRSFPYSGVEQLTAWLRANTPPDAVVLSSFNLQPTIFRDAERAIVLHPKFESPAMRDKVREYLESFFAPSERRFHEFCVRNKADYFVLNLGMFATPKSKGWIYSWPYMAGATDDLLNTVGTSWMYKDPAQCGYFRFCQEIGARGQLQPLYRIFEVISEEEIRQAEQCAALGASRLMSYKEYQEPEDLTLAVEWLEEAVRLWPGCAEAHKTLVSVYALRGEDAKAVEALRRRRQFEQRERQER